MTDAVLGDGSIQAGTEAAALRPQSLGAAAWTKILVLAVLMVGLFWQYNLIRLWRKVNLIDGELSWQHSLFVPVIGLYFLYVNRDRLLAARVQPDWRGLVLMLVSMAVFMYGVYPGQNEWVSDAGMVMTLFGLTLFICGREVMKVAWFPILFLFCGIPWPGLVYSKVALPLQELAAKVAVFVLQICNVEAQQTGTKIYMGGVGSPIRTLNVAEACAGLRSLMTFITVAAALAFLSVRPLWQKLIMTASAVPIAILCNVMRIAVQGLLDHYVSTQLSEGFAHATVGLIMLLPAFFLILLVGWVLDRIFVEEAAAPEGRFPVNAADSKVIVRRAAVAKAVEGAGGIGRTGETV